MAVMQAQLHTTVGRPIPQPDTVIAGAIAAKVLQFWLQNRYQTRTPLVLNLRNLTAEQAGILIDTVAYALAAVQADECRMADARRWLVSVGAAPTMVERLGPDAACPFGLLRAHGLEAQGYAASVRGVGVRRLVARRFLDYLAARLGLSDDVARSLNRRYAS